MLPANSFASISVVPPQVHALSNSPVVSMRPLVITPSKHANQSLPVCDFFKSMREFPQHILQNQSLLKKAMPETLNINLNETQLTSTSSPEWPNRVASSVRFIHVPEASLIEGPQLLEYGARYLHLSANDRLNLHEYIDQQAKVVPPFHNLEHKNHDRLVLFVKHGEALSSIQAQIATLLGDGFNDKLWSFVQSELTSNATNITQDGVVDITSIRNQAVQNSLAKMVSQPLLKPYFEFISWVQARSEEGSVLVHLEKTSLDKAYGLLNFAEAKLLQVGQKMHQLPQAYAYGAGDMNTKVIRAIGDTGHLSAINDYFQSELQADEDEVEFPQNLTSQALAGQQAGSQQVSDSPHWLSLSQVPNDSIVSLNKSHLFEIPAGASKLEASLELQRLLGNQLFSMEEHTLLNRINWEGERAINTSVLDISEYVDRVVMSVLLNLNANQDLDAYRDMSNAVLDECRQLTDLNFYELSQVFLSEKVNEAIQVSLAALNGQSTSGVPAIINEDQDLQKVINIIGRNLGHKSANTVWDAQLTSPNQKALAVHYLQLLLKQKVTLQIHETVDALTQAPLEI